LKRPIGPSVEVRKTMSLTEIKGFEESSIDRDDKISRGNNDTSHAWRLMIETTLKKMTDP
jgi:hypothetical protein